MVIQKLDKEIKLGRVAGPFDTLPLPNLIVSPVGLVPKAEKVNLDLFITYPSLKGDLSMMGLTGTFVRSLTRNLMMQSS